MKIRGTGDGSSSNDYGDVLSSLSAGLRISLCGVLCRCRQISRFPRFVGTISLPCQDPPAYLEGACHTLTCRFHFISTLLHSSYLLSTTILLTRVKRFTLRV